MKWPFFLLVLISGFACTNQETITSFGYDEIKQGKCAADSLHLYHFTQPKMVTGKLPLLILLDSGGDGLYAINKVLPAAANTPCIIVASDLIKNNYREFLQAISTLIEEAKGRFSVAPDQVYIGGFSGGARMAFEYAIRYPLKGVLMCGAGPSGESTNFPFPVYMISGVTDFNFSEIYVNPLKTKENNNFITDYFRGGHEWPPAGNIKDGLIFLLAGENRDLKKKQSINLTEKADSLIRNNETLFGIKAVEKAIRLDPANRKAIKLKKQIQSDRKFSRNLLTLESNLNLERKIGQAYAQESFNQDSLWWFNEIDQLYKEIGSTSGEEKDHFLRIKAFLGILFFSRMNAFLSSDPMSTRVEHLLAAYRKAEPANPDVYFDFAVFEKKRGNLSKSKYYLEKAKDLGFKDQARLSEFSD